MTKVDKILKKFKILILILIIGFFIYNYEVLIVIIWFFTPKFVLDWVASLDPPKHSYQVFLQEIKRDYKPQVFDGVREPDKFPDLVLNDETVLGIDSNHDGVRDDIEILLNRFYDKEMIKRNIEKEHARYIQKYFVRAQRMTKPQLKAALIYSMDIWEQCENFLQDGYHIISGDSYEGRLENVPKIMPHKHFFHLLVDDAIYNTESRKYLRRKMFEGLKGGDEYGGREIPHREAYEFCPAEVKKKYPFVPRRF